MKKEVRTEILLGSVLLMLFLISFYNFLKSRDDSQGIKQNRIYDESWDADDTKESMGSGENRISEGESVSLNNEKAGELHEPGAEGEAESRKNVASNEVKISENTKLYVVNLSHNSALKKMNVKMNSMCLEMGFTEFRNLLETSPMTVLTQEVYELIPEYQPGTDTVTLLNFDREQIVLGITCGKTQVEDVKTLFNYLAIVDGTNLTIYQIDDANDYTTIYFECKAEDLNIPPNLLQSLESGIYFHDEKELYNFLESYTS